MTRAYLEQSERSAAAGANSPPPDETRGAAYERVRGQAQRLKASAGWSNAEMARRLDMSQATLSEWMNGTYKGNISAITFSWTSFS